MEKEAGAQGSPLTAMRTTRSRARIGVYLPKRTVFCCFCFLLLFLVLLVLLVLLVVYVNFQVFR